MLRLTSRARPSRSTASAGRGRSVPAGPCSSNCQRLRPATRATGAGATHVYPLQIVAMSATMAGLDAAAAWLGARLFLTDHRPTPLAEHVAIGREIYGLIKGVGLTPQPVRMLPAVGRK